MSRHAHGMQIKSSFWLNSVFVFFLGLINAFDAQASRIDGDTVVLLGDRSEISALEATRYWHPATETTLDDAKKAFQRQQFKPLPQHKSNLGFVDGPYWFVLRVRNDSHNEHHWVLVINYSLLDHIWVYETHEDKVIATHHSGDRVGFSNRTFNNRRPNFAFNLEHGEERLFFIRVESQSSMQVPLLVSTSEAFLQDANAGQLGLGLYYGILLALLCYNLILYTQLREKIYLAYVAYVSLYGVLQACLNGFSFQYFWPNLPNWGNTAVPLMIALGLGSMCVFSTMFLDLKQYAPRLHRFMRGLIALHVILAIATLFLPYRLTVMIGTAMVFLDIPLIGFAAALGVIHKRAAAVLFSLAWAAFLLGVVAYASVSFGLLPKMFLTEYGLQIGSALEMILLSLSLADRINSLTRENVRIQKEAREQLESRVEERTTELNDALYQLRNANIRLREFAQRDGLTETLNRRFLDDALQKLWDEAVALKQPFAMIMIDLDYFKAINDQHGHLIGDDCLRQMARTLESFFSIEGQNVVRYGGEEFLVLLSNCIEPEAKSLAEAVRQHVANNALQCGDVNVPITVSMGIAHIELASPTHNPIEMIQAADAALYRAKKSGRNRIETHAFKPRMSS